LGLPVSLQTVVTNHELDHESRTTSQDHGALRLWLRLLTCTNLMDSHITALADQLEAEGLISRVADAADRRSTRLKLTRQGERDFAQMAQAHERWIIELTDGLSKQDQRTLFSLLGKLKTSLQSMPSSREDQPR
jgi:hypothetical protein